MPNGHLTVPPPPALEQPQPDVQEQMILVNRYRKARKIASKLLAHGADADAVIELGKSHLGMRLAAEAAGANTPSTTTWALVIELVREVRP